MLENFDLDKVKLCDKDFANRRSLIKSISLNLML